ncbi:MAG: MarR family transcriptional regulator [Acidobacteria bacterium]|nr:MarR family transcriptional regulator [Acidobacteriota bacterium]
MPPGGLAPPDREEWASLYTAFAILRKESDRALSPWRITVPQASVLALLTEAGRPLPVTRLARLLLQESPSVTSLVDRMCAGGLVERAKDPRDRRVVLVQLTSKGRQTHDAMRATATSFSDELFGVLSADERAILKGLLQKFAYRNIQRIR